MVLLSFDIEEFDMPLEYNGEISFEEQIAISRKGTEIILDLLKKYDIRATFFSTVIFAQHNLDIIQRILNEGHELASHTWFHSEFEAEHLLKSKIELERISGKKIFGLRMPRMSPVSEKEVFNAGYHYNSSINPTFLPGRYNHLDISRTPFIQENVLQIPASVSPIFRIPLFWLSFHNFPISFYIKLLNKTYQKDGYVNIYFHPWEFIDIENKKYKLPFYAKRNVGDEMKKRFEKLLSWIKEKKLSTNTITEFANYQ